MGRYYDINKTLSYGRLFNFVVGPRGAGKTYAFKDRAIRNFLKKGEQFVYLRRYDTELPAAEMRNYFDDIKTKYPDHEFKAFQGLFRIDGEIAGWYFPLSKAIMLKSIPFPNVTMIGFDEFIIDVGIYRYLPREVNTFLECYSTISRDRDVPAFFLSNAISFSNPYFVYFDLCLEEGQTLKLKGDISLELIRNDEYTEHMNNTRFGKLIAGTEYGNYNINNTFLRDTDTFVEKMTNACEYWTTVVVDGQEFGVFIDRIQELIFFTSKVDKNFKLRMAINSDDHDATTLLVRRSGSVILNMIVEYFLNGRVRFETIHIKNTCEKFIKKLL